MDDFGLKKQQAQLKLLGHSVGQQHPGASHEDWEASYGSGSCSQGCPTTPSWGPGQDRAGMVSFTSNDLEMHQDIALLLYS